MRPVASSSIVLIAAVLLACTTLPWFSRERLADSLVRPSCSSLSNSVSLARLSTLQRFLLSRSRSALIPSDLQIRFWIVHGFELRIIPLRAVKMCLTAHKDKSSTTVFFASGLLSVHLLPRAAWKSLALPNWYTQIWVQSDNYSPTRYFKLKQSSIGLDREEDA